VRLEEQKKKDLKTREIETKKYLDLQIQEKNARNNLTKVQDNMEGKYINEDVRVYHEEEKRRRAELEKQKKAHQNLLQRQMEEGKVKGPPMASHEYMLNKKIIEGIESKNSPTLTKKTFLIK